MECSDLDGIFIPLFLCPVLSDQDEREDKKEDKSQMEWIIKVKHYIHIEHLTHKLTPSGTVYPRLYKVKPAKIPAWMALGLLKSNL